VVRRSILRTAFFADLVFAMDFPQSDRRLSRQRGDLAKTADLRAGAPETRLMTAKARL
jgi:hypothetical protein